MFDNFTYRIELGHQHILCAFLNLVEARVFASIQAGCLWYIILHIILPAFHKLVGARVQASIQANMTVPEVHNLVEARVLASRVHTSKTIHHKRD